MNKTDEFAHSETIPTEPIASQRETPVCSGCTDPDSGLIRRRNDFQDNPITSYSWKRLAFAYDSSRKAMEAKKNKPVGEEK